jgi:hypothetical protein
MPSAKRERHRARRAAGRLTVPPAAVEPSLPSKRKTGPCERCGAGCRSEKPLYGWVCASCVYELDQYLIVRLGTTGGTVASAYAEAKRRGELPPPGPRGRGVNVRKPMPPGLTV